MTDLSEFLLARLDEDEAEVERSRIDDAPEWWMPDWLTRTRVLAQVAAMREIVKIHSGPWCGWTQDSNSWHGDRGPDGMGDCDTLRALASIWADHETYDPEWRLG